MNKLKEERKKLKNIERRYKTGRKKEKMEGKVRGETHGNKKYGKWNRIKKEEGKN